MLRKSVAALSSLLAGAAVFASAACAQSTVPAVNSAQAQAQPQAGAQGGAAPARPAQAPRVGPSLELAVEAAQKAVSTCIDAGFRTTVLVADAEGVAVALLSAGSARTVGIAPTKVAIVRKYGVPSIQIVERVRTDPALAAEIAADPAIGQARGGALAIQSSAGTTIGYIAVAGAPTGEQDEVCARAGIDAISARLG